MKQLFSLALAACLPLAAHASAPHDAQASVPAVVYRSAFDTYQPAAQDQATPDESWRAVNQKVGDAGGHMGHMMKNHQPMPMPAGQPVPQHQHQHQHQEH